MKAPNTRAYKVCSKEQYERWCFLPKLRTSGLDKGSSKKRKVRSRKVSFWSGKPRQTSRVRAAQEASTSRLLPVQRCSKRRQLVTLSNTWMSTGLMVSSTCDASIAEWRCNTPLVKSASGSHADLVFPATPRTARHSIRPLLLFVSAFFFFFRRFSALLPACQPTEQACRLGSYAG